MAPLSGGDKDPRELSIEARVSHAAVRTMKDLYGRGPTHAKTYLCDEYVFCVMSGGMTRDEETMIRGGEQGRDSREFRSAMNASVRATVSPRTSSGSVPRLVSFAAAPSPARSRRTRASS
jgi:hypothetical protein